MINSSDQLPQRTVPWRCQGPIGQNAPVRSADNH